MADASKEGRRKRCLEMQDRIMKACHPVVLGSQRRASTLHRQLKMYLKEAHSRNLIVEGPDAIDKMVQISESVPEIDTATHSIAVGSTRNFDRLRNASQFPHFTRKFDNAWFDFQLSVAETKEGLKILAYEFELRTDQKQPFDFVRFDFNPEDADNVPEGLRSHIHLCSDDDGFSVPTILMSPYEVLDVMVYGAQKTGRVRRRKV